MSIFREYDIRGIFEAELNCDMVYNIGLNLGDEIKARGGKSVAIGFDARNHSKILLEWLASGLIDSGIRVYNLGLIPTPVAYFSLYCDFRLDSSVMITGSHNPPEYNGFKITINKEPFYGQDIQNLGEKCRDLKPFKINDLAQNLPFLNALEKYIEFLSTHFSHLKSFKHKIAVDCGNGVAGVAIESVLKNLNIDFIPLFFDPNGDFLNHHPDPSEQKNLADLKNAMQKNHINIGIAFDGDADRLGFLTQNINFSGDLLAILFAKNMAKNGLKPLIIGEVKCSQVMYDEINKIGRAIMYKTGHSNLKVKLKESGALLAAEMSGHIFFNDRYFGYDDAIYSAFRALELFLDSSIEAVENEILSLPKMFSTSEEKIKSSEEMKFRQIELLKSRLKNPPSDFPHIKEIIEIDGLRVIFDSGWGLVRASNTTPVLVTRFEADSKQNAEFYKQKLLGLLK